MERKILQICPADGFFAETKDGPYPLIGWALVESRNSAGDPYTEVIGLVSESGNPYGCYADLLSKFVGYSRSYSVLSTETQPKKGKK